MLWRGGVTPGGKGVPGNREGGGEGGGGGLETAHFTKAGEIGEFAFGHVALGEGRVEAIEAEEDQLPDFGVLVSLAAGQSAPGHTERPQEHGDEAEEESAEQGEKAAEEGEAGARTDICQVWSEEQAHRSLPSTNGTSNTFLCMMGPWPKKPLSPKSSP